MARRVDTGKLVVWQKRLAQFDGSGLSVAEYCRREGIASHQFHYWSRRMRETGDVSQGPVVEVGEANARHVEHVEVFVGNDVRVSLPVSEPGLVASVVGASNGAIFV